MGKSLVRFAQERLDPFVIHHLGTVKLGCEHEAFGLYQQVTLTALELLASVITPIFPAYRGGLYRLGIHHARAGLRIPFQANPKALADGPVDPLPGTPSMRQVLK